MATRYFELLDQAAADPDVKVIVVTGAGRGFCAGADMETCLLYTSDAADERSSVDLGGRRIIKKKKHMIL